MHPAMPLVIYLPLIVASLYFAFAHDGLSILAIVLLFAFGIAIWTLFEYVIHRYAFHYEPSSNIGKQFHLIVYGVHNDYPNDGRRLVMPPVISIPLAILFYALFASLFGAAAPAVWAGLVAGYACR